MTVVDYSVSCAFHIRQRNAVLAVDIHTVPIAAYGCVTGMMGTMFYIYILNPLLLLSL